MTSLQKGLLLAGVQLALVASLAAKYAIDRARLPRVWVQTVAYDPSLPIRGRYVSVRLVVAMNGAAGSPQNFARDVTLKVQDGHLVAEPADHATGLHVSRWRIGPGVEGTVLAEPVAFFLPEHAADPSRHVAGEQVWVEVSVPKTGRPRPIRLATGPSDVFTPLKIQ